MPITRSAVQTYGSSGTSLSHAPQIPAGASVGDLLVMSLGNRQTGNIPSQPSGWELGSIDSTGAAHNLTTLWRICQAGDPGSTVTLTWGTATDAQGGIASYAGVDPVNPMDVALTKTINAASSNTHTAPSITPVSANTWLLHIWVSGGTSQWTGADLGTQVFNAVASAGTARPTLMYERAGPAAGVASSAITATLVAANLQSCTMHSLALRELVDQGITDTMVVGRARW